MRVLHGDPTTWEARRPHVVTIGVFDGVHQGHRHVIDLVKSEADRTGLGSGLITFDRHPLTVLAPEHAPALLTSLDRRLEMFEQAGLDTVGVLPFGDAVRTLSPEHFVSRVIVMGLGARLVVVGEDFRFGRDRAGNVQVLSLLGTEMGFEVEPVSLLNQDGPLSSSRIRTMLAEGDVEAAAAALGRCFELRGRVAQEPGQGASIGIPTADLIVSEGLAIPGSGVYAVLASLEDHSGLAGAAYLGERPTSGGTRRVIHFHLLDTGMELDGASIDLQFVSRLRGEEHFSGPDELATAIKRDLAAAQRLLGRQAP